MYRYRCLFDTNGGELILYLDAVNDHNLKLKIDQMTRHTTLICKSYTVVTTLGTGFNTYYN